MPAPASARVDGENRTRFLAPADARPSSYDPATRTALAVLATSQPVDRFDGLEVLEITGAAVDLTRAETGRLPLLFGHDPRDPIGTVRRVWIEAGRLVGEIQFADTPRGRLFAGMAERGELVSISVGYRPKAGRQVGDAFHIVRWELLEASIVSVPADTGAHIRSYETPMPTQNLRPTPADPLPEDDGAPVSPPASRGSRGDATMRAERQRAADIAMIAGRAGFSPDEATQAIEDGETVESFRRRAFDRLAAANPPSISILRDEGDTRHRGAITTALAGRIMGRAPTNDFERSIYNGGIVGAIRASAPDQYRGLSDAETIDAAMNRAGAGWSGRNAMHSTSDFPVLLSGALNLALAEYFQAAVSPLAVLFRTLQADDFRPLTRLRPGAISPIEKVGQHGEIKSGSIGDATTEGGTAVETFAKVFGLTRQALVNDNLGFFGDLSRLLARQAAHKVNEAMAGVLLANGGDGATLADGNPLFHVTSHKNRAAAGSGLSVASLSAARQAMRGQADVDGVTPLNVVGRYLVVSPAQETEAEALLTAINATTVSGVNPFAGKLELLVEPRLSGSAWRIFADPALYPVLEVAYLSGFEVPRVEVREGWSSLGAEWRVVHEFGVGAGDWRGAYLNPGA